MRWMLSLVFAIILGSSAAIPYMLMGHQVQSNVKASTTAGEARDILTAAQEYIKAYYSQVEANASPTKPATITVPMLESTGKLSTAYKTLNPWAQKWEVQVLEPSPGKLQALLLSYGGAKIPERIAPEIATEVGAAGGFVPYQGEYGNLGPSIAQGAYGHWSVSMAGYADPGSGHLAALLAFNHGNLENDYLYRVAVPGHPKLNTMETALNMGKNNINAASNISAAKGAIEIGTGGTTACNANARLHLAGSQVWDGCDGDLHLYPGGGNGSAVSTSANMQVGRSVNAGGTLAGGYLMSRGNVQANGSYYTNGQIYFNNHYIAPGWGCNQYGELVGSTYGGGTMLVCHYGRWTKTGGSGPFQQIIASGTGRGGFSWYNGTGKTEFYTVSIDNVNMGNYGRGQIDLYVCGIHVGEDADWGNIGSTGSPVSGQLAAPIPPGCSASGSAGGYEGAAPYFYAVYK